jgi:hypothetical protein
VRVAEEVDVAFGPAKRPVRNFQQLDAPREIKLSGLARKDPPVACRVQERPAPELEVQPTVDEEISSMKCGLKRGGATASTSTCSAPIVLARSAKAESVATT